MKTLGIITEYNPFHNGHLYHLKQSLQSTNSDATICVMSGHFLQRGTPAIMDKWTRAKNAIENGVDLVIELPTVYSMNSAEFFAKGSIELFNALNKIDVITFGSENGNIEPFLTIGEIYSKEPKDFKIKLKKHLNNGISFPNAREKALRDYLGNDISIDSKPNNILGIEYSKAIFSTSSKIKLETIIRTSNDYYEKNLTGNISSATAIRNSIKDNFNLNEIKSTVPNSTYDSLCENKNDLIFRDDFEDLVFYKIRSMSLKELSEIHDVTEGLENRIKNMSLKTETLEDLIQAIKTKRYTYTRIQRILFKILLNIKKEDVYHSPRYIRVLGFNQKGQKIIKELNETCTLPIITNLKNYKPQDDIARMMIETDIRATNIYQIMRNKKTGNLDYLKKPVIIK